MAFTPNDDINILQASDSLNVGAGAGDDRYILSSGQMTDGQIINITDTEGTNTLHLVNVTIASSVIAGNALQLTLSNGAVVNVFGADNFSYLVGGDSLSGTGGTVQDYATFATSTLGAANVPDSGTVNGADNVVIGSDTGGGDNGGGDGDGSNDVLANVFTLREDTLAPATEPTEKVLMWGYNPIDDGGIPASELLNFLVNIAGVNFLELGLIDDDGVDPAQALSSISNITIADINTADSDSTITFQTTDGQFFTAEASLGEDYLSFLSDLIFDADGNSRLYMADVDTGYPAEEYHHVILTPTENNGYTFEDGFTTAGNDIIVSGHTEWLHGAYIDGGAGYNILEVDAKGDYAQPAQLLNIQEVSVQNLPNVYGGGLDSILDLSRAWELEKLTVTEGWDNGEAPGNLSIVGIRNGVTTRLEGGFTEDLYLHYGRDIKDSVTLELSLGDTDGFNLHVAQNTNTLNLVSEGNENWLDSGYFGGMLRTLNVSGDAALYIADDLSDSFHDARTATIDASENTAGVELTLNDHPSLVHFIGTQAGDEFTAKHNEAVNIEAGAGHNVFNTDESKVVNVLAGEGNDSVSSLGSESVTVNAGAGNNTVAVQAAAIVVTSGDGSDHVTIIGSDDTFVNGDDTDIDNNPVGVSDANSPGALITLSLGDGSNTLVLGGTDLNDDELGITALEGSSITGSNIAVFVANDSDLTEATLEGITSVQLKQELTLTAEQVAQIGAEAFSVFRAAFGATEDLHIVISEDTVLSELLDLSALSTNVRLNFEIHNGATLTLTAEELHTHVAENGINGEDGLNGKIVITDAGLNFDPFDNGVDNYLVIDGGTVSGGSLDATNDVTVIRSLDGYERPEPADSTDTLTIDTTGDAPLIIEDAIDSTVKTLEIIGDQDIEFQMPVSLGTDFTIDFSDLAGSVTSLTVADFEDVKQIIGNHTGTRINVEINDGETVGSAGNANGLKTSGVTTYVVTEIVDETDEALDESEATVYLCDLTQDVETVGFQGNYNDTINFMQVNWGIHFLLEAGGDAKADGNPNYANIGHFYAEYFWDGEGAHADSMVTINNQGETSDRPINVASIEINNADSITINAEDGDVIIESLDGNSVDDLTFTSANDITVRDFNGLELMSLDASAVDGEFTIELSNALDLSATAVSGVDAVVFAHDDAELTVTRDQLDEIGLGNLSVAEGVTHATLNLYGLDDSVFSAPDLPEGLNVGSVILAEGDIVLDPATDLTGVESIEVPEGSTLTLTAEQFNQLGSGVIEGVDGTTDFTVNITDLTQADVDNLDADGMVQGIDLSDITGNVTVELAEDIAFNEESDLGSASILMDDDQTVGLATEAQADGRDISGGSNITVEFLFTDPAIDNIDASGYDIDTLRLDDDLAANKNVEVLLENLSSDVLVEITDFVESVDPTNRMVDILPGVTVSGELVFNDVQIDREVVTLTLSLLGDSAIEGALRLPTVDSTPFDASNFDTLVINSLGDMANSLGDINADGQNVDEIDNNLLNIEINAEQDLTVGDITFSSINPEATATLTVVATGDVVMGALDASDVDIDSLDIIHTGEGGLTIDIDADSNIGSITGSATGITTLNIDGTVNLSAATLNNIDAIVLADGAELTLTQAQFDAIGAGSFSVPDAEGGDDATLNIVGLGEDPADFAGLADGVNLGSVTVVALDDVVLDITTDLTGVTNLIVPDGTQLTMSAEQFKQLVASGATIDTNTSGSVVVDLNGDLSIGTADEATIDGSDVTFVMADGETLDVDSFSMADGLSVVGDDTATVKPLVNFTFDFTSNGGTPIDSTIDVENYQEVDLRILDSLLDQYETQSIEDLLDNLDNANILNIYQEAVVVDLDPRDRVVVVEPEAAPDGIEFSAVGALADYVRSIDLTLQANADNAASINGDIFVNDGQVRTGYTMLTINTEDTSGADPLTADPIVIDGQILSNGIAAGNAGELLSITINADVDLEVTDKIIFNSDTAGSEATLTVAGSADVTLKDLDTTDADITALTVDTTGYTGTLTITGGSDALELNDTESLTFTGSGDIVLDTSDSDPADPAVDNNHGIQGDILTLIDLSDFTGTIDLGVIQQVSPTDFTFTSGNGTVSLTLGGADTVEGGLVLNADPLADPVEPGWSFDLGANTTLTINSDVTFTKGELNITGTGTVIIDGVVDLRNLVDVDGNSLITLGADVVLELAEGAGLLMTDEQWAALPAAVQDAIIGDGQALDLTNADTVTGLVDAGLINTDPNPDLGWLTDLRGVTSVILPEDGMLGDLTDTANIALTPEQAAIAYTVDNNGDRSTWDDDADAGTAEVEREDGDFREFGGRVGVIISQDADVTGLQLENDGGGDDDEIFILDPGAVAVTEKSSLTITTGQSGLLTTESMNSPLVDLQVLTIAEDIVGGSDVDGNDIIVTRNIVFTNDGTNVTVDAHAQALASAQAGVFGANVNDLLSSGPVTTITVNTVGTTPFLTQNEPLDALGGTEDETFTFEFIAGTVTSAGTGGDGYTKINNFVVGADEDVLDFDAFFTATDFAAVAGLDGTADNTGTADILSFTGDPVVDFNPGTLETAFAANGAFETSTTDAIEFGEGAEKIFVVTDNVNTAIFHWQDDNTADAGLVDAGELTQIVLLGGDLVGTLVAENFGLVTVV